MKKLVLLLVCMFTMHTMVMADNDKPIQVNQLLQRLKLSSIPTLKIIKWH